jgi:hypothetical protein
MLNEKGQCACHKKMCNRLSSMGLDVSSHRRHAGMACARTSVLNAFSRQAPDAEVTNLVCGATRARTHLNDSWADEAGLWVRRN